jgi:hypothetical protein
MGMIYADTLYVQEKESIIIYTIDREKNIIYKLKKK